MRSLCLSCSFALLAACGGPESPADAGTDAGPPYPAYCENINLEDCLLPWPSSFYLADDPSTNTGSRISIPEDAMPRSQRGRVVSPAQWSRFDGFSPMTPIITSYPGEVDPATLHDETEIDATLEASSTTLLIDAATGALVPHWAEIDQWVFDSDDFDPTRRALYLRPAVRLAEDHRYVVAIRGLSYADGSPVEPSTYFRALRDGTPLPDSDIEDRRAHFEDVFTIAATAGAPRAELIEAWDFSTASGESIWGDLVAMRDDALMRAGDRGLGCTVQQVTEQADADEHVFRQVLGTVTVPLYLNGVDAYSSEESRLHRGPDGAPLANGTAEVPFIAQIPISVADDVRTGGAPGRLEVYGHGLFGDRFEVEAGWHRDHQDRLAVVSVAVDWWGMSTDDLPRVALTLQNFTDFDATSERLQQSIINVLVLARSFRGVCADLPEMQVPLEAGGTAPAIDTSAAYYYGNSQGGIMGGVVAGVATDIERFALGVGGMSYPLMVKRSANWQTYGALMANGYPDALTADLLMVMSASLWDIAEPSTYSTHLVSDPLPGTIAKRILMQIGVGDSQVPNVSGELQARAIGIPYLTPAPYTPWNLPSTAGPADSALVIYSIPGAEPALPGTRDPGSDNPAHEGVRRSAAAMDQIDRFWRPTGQIEQTCDGVCDPI